MASIITQDYKKLLLEKALEDLQDSASPNYYYAAIGRSVAWDSADTEPTPLRNERDIRLARYEIQSMKNITDYSFVVPRFRWSLGAIYSAYDDQAIAHPIQSYYVMNEENQVYVCLQQGKDADGNPNVSTVQPTGTLTTPFSTSDGYIWKFLYTVGALSAANYLSANYMPVKLQNAVDSASPAADVEQLGIQNAANIGQEVIGGVVTSGGSGYSSAPTVSIVGDGTGARLDATISGGAVTKLEIAESDGTLLIGSGYSYAHIEFSGGGGSGAAARPVFGPIGGLGADPRDDLRASAIMFNTKPSGEEGGAFITTNDFRQVSLVRNPKIPVTDSDFTAEAGNALRKLKFSSISSAFSNDNLIVGSTSQAQAYVDKIDSDLIWYHQNEDTGFTQFVEGEAISEPSGSGAGVLQSAGADADSNAYIEPDVNPFSGDILYIDNRAPILRDPQQTEDLKIIIQL